MGEGEGKSIELMRTPASAVLEAAAGTLEADDFAEATFEASAALEAAAEESEVAAQPARPNPSEAMSTSPQISLTDSICDLLIAVSRSADGKCDAQRGVSSSSSSRARACSS